MKVRRKFLKTGAEEEFTQRGQVISMPGGSHNSAGESLGQPLKMSPAWSSRLG